MKKHDFVKYFEKFTVRSSLITLSMQFYRPILNYLAKMSIILGNFGRQFTHNTRSNHHTNDPIWHPNNLSCKARASVKITHKVLHSKWIFGVKNKQIRSLEQFREKQLIKFLEQKSSGRVMLKIWGPPKTKIFSCHHNGNIMLFAVH